MRTFTVMDDFTALAPVGFDIAVLGPWQPKDMVRHIHISSEGGVASYRAGMMSRRPVDVADLDANCRFFSRGTFQLAAGAHQMAVGINFEMALRYLILFVVAGAVNTVNGVFSAEVIFKGKETVN